MTVPAVFWPTVLGLAFLAFGIFAYRRELRARASRGVFGLASLGPILVAASLAAFAGEHFTAAKSLAALVPKWMPAPLLIAYFVGVAHLAAATSLVARRYIRWSTIFLAIMFALFVLLLFLPSLVRHPTNHIAWIFPGREGTFAIGALALFASEVRPRRATLSNRISAFARIWTAVVLTFFGALNILYPQYSPGVPDNQLTAPWVPAPHAIAYLAGTVLIICGIAMFFRRYASAAATSAGLLMVLLTLALFVPSYFLARSVPQFINALNFVFDTLLFAGMLFAIATAISGSERRPLGIARTAN